MRRPRQERSSSSGVSFDNFLQVTPFKRPPASSKFSCVFETAYTTVAYTAASTSNATQISFTPNATWAGAFDSYKIKSATLNMIILGTGMTFPMVIAYEPSAWTGATTYASTIARKNARQIQSSEDNNKFSYKVTTPAHFLGTPGNGETLVTAPMPTDSGWAGGTVRFVPAGSVTGTLQYNWTYELEFYGPRCIY